jgi:hypothetical protein
MPTHGDVDLVDAKSMTLLGVLLMGLINSSFVRSVVRKLSKSVAVATREALVDLPRWVLGLAWVRRVLESRWFRWSWRFGVKPLAMSAVLWLALPQDYSNARLAAVNAAALFLLVNLLINSRVGRTAEEVLLDWSRQAWHRFALRFVAGLFNWTVDFFRGLLRMVERFMYSVDEWLRFRTGESRLTFWAKAALGSAWFFVTYITRFCITLLIEPQVNPIKHFPVVTVSHKVLLPFIPYLGEVFYEQAPRFGVEMAKAEAITLATLIITSIPGIFGFFAWELKESWRLFAATRSRLLRPALVGDHGETISRLLRRGFHSGTLPKRFQKLRRAERNARRHGSWRAVRKNLQALHHLETALRHFVERDLLAPLVQCEAWFASIRVAEVRLGPAGVFARLGCDGPLPDSIVFQVDRGPTHNVAISYEVPDFDRPAFNPSQWDEPDFDRPGAEALRRVRLGVWWGREGFGLLSLRSRGGWIAADFIPGPAVASLNEAQRAELANALVGFYKAAGVELIQQQIETWFPPPEMGFDAIERGLRVWSWRKPGLEMVLDLGDQEPDISPDLSLLFGEKALALSRSVLLFTERDVAWRDWIAAWTPPCDDLRWGDTMAASGGAIDPRRLLPDVPVLGPSKAESAPP